MVCSTPERSAATAATNQTIAVDSTTIATERPLAAWRIPSVSPLGVDASLRLVSMLALDATASSLAAVTARSMPITGTSSICSPPLLEGVAYPDNNHLVVEPDDSVRRRPGPSRDRHHASDETAARRRMLAPELLRNRVSPRPRPGRRNLFDEATEVPQALLVPPGHNRKSFYWLSPSDRRISEP